MPPRKANRRRSPVRDAVQVAPEVADHAVHVEARDRARSARPRRRSTTDCVDVERHVALERSPRRPSRRAARASSTPCRSRARRAPRRRSRSTIAGAWRLRISRSQRRRVVLGQRRDAVEQLRAALVVEVLRRQLACGCGRARRGRRRRACPCTLVALDLTTAASGSRPPRSGSRRRSAGAAGGPSCGRSLRATRGRVAHEPPRSTR